LTEGDTTRHPELAASLGNIALGGSDGLYVDLANAIVASVENSSVPGRMTVNDLTGYRAVDGKYCVSH
jgi:gamma-glutamyltranspeptidase